jgi:hypothetical protein
LAAAIIEHFVIGASGAFEALTPESTRPIAEARTHAGKVQRYAFDMSYRARW